MPFPPKVDPEKFCEVCGVKMTRKRYNGRLEDRTRFIERRTCGQSCGNTKREVVNDTLHWRARKHLAAACQVCGTTERLHVHHIDRNPENNETTNLATLCASCHLKLHWREDREKRLAGVRRGVTTRQQSIAGNSSLGGQRLRPLNQPAGTERGD